MTPEPVPVDTTIDQARAIAGVLVVKRRWRTDPADWYAVTRFGDWCAMARDAGFRWGPRWSFTGATT